MRRFLLLQTLVFICLVVFAQNRMVTVANGTRIRDAFTYSDIYLFPTFYSGVIYYRDNQTAFGQMNYNRFTGAIDFIKGKDTLELAHPEAIKSVELQKNIFYYQFGTGYILYLNGTDAAAFGRMEKVYLTREKGSRFFPSSVGAYNYFDNPVSGKGTSIIYAKKRTEFYFANKNGFFVRPTEKNVVEIYPKKKDIISAYLTKHHVNFKKEKSLQGLFNAIISQP
jgi:hypothetical protein